ncbi:MAG: hypothetical protein K0S74_211 [Chlamydiales bacterium]|nr:hypothetical protein [Chlamydiales bacterium]
MVSKEDFEHGQAVIDENKAYCGPAFISVANQQDSIAVTKGNPGLVHAPDSKTQPKTNIIDQGREWAYNKVHGTLENAKVYVPSEANPVVQSNNREIARLQAKYNDNIVGATNNLTRLSLFQIFTVGGSINLFETSFERDLLVTQPIETVKGIASFTVDTGEFAARPFTEGAKLEETRLERVAKQHLREYAEVRKTGVPSLKSRLPKQRVKRAAVLAPFCILLLNRSLRTLLRKRSI